MFSRKKKNMSSPSGIADLPESPIINKDNISKLPSVPLDLSEESVSNFNENENDWNIKEQKLIIYMGDFKGLDSNNQHNYKEYVSYWLDDYKYRELTVDAL